MSCVHSAEPKPDVDISKTSSPTPSARQEVKRLKKESDEVLDNNSLRSLMEKAVKVAPNAGSSKHASDTDEDGNPSKKTKLLGELLEGNKTVMFGTGLLPKEQPEFVSSTVVSTTTLWKKGDGQEGEGPPGQCTSSSGGSGGGPGSGGVQRKKARQYVLLQQLLMEDDGNSKKSESGDKKSQDSTTSPTVTTTKPHMPAVTQEGVLNLPGGDIGEGLEESDAIMQQLITAFNSIDDQDPSKQSAINELLKELENPNNDMGSEQAGMSAGPGGDSSMSQFPPKDTKPAMQSGVGNQPGVGGQPAGMSNQAMMPGMHGQGNRASPRPNQGPGALQNQVPKSIANMASMMAPPNQTAPVDSGMTTAQSMAAQQMLRGQQQPGQPPQPPSGQQGVSLSSFDPCIMTTKPPPPPKKKKKKKKNPLIWLESFYVFCFLRM